MLRFSYRPLPPIWPFGDRTRYPERSRFRAGRAETLRLLEHELGELGVATWSKPIILEAGYREGDIRQDGLPRADAKLRDQAVILSFETRHGPLRYGTDRFTAFDDNLRAIALSLQALRAVDRYGVTHKGEQYRGWLALPPGPATAMTREEAIAFLEREGGNPLTSHGVTELWAGAAYRRIAKRAHPDAGGDPELWTRLERAKEALGL